MKNILVHTYMKNMKWSLSLFCVLICLLSCLFLYSSNTQNLCVCVRLSDMSVVLGHMKYKYISMKKYMQGG